MSQDPQNPLANRTVHLVFEEMETDEESGLSVGRVYLEYPGREINDDVLQGEDTTFAECWSVRALEFVVSQLAALAVASDRVVMQSPKKGDMN